MGKIDVRDPAQVRADVIQLMTLALDAAETPDQLFDCAQAAARLGDTSLIDAVRLRLIDSIDEHLGSAEAWHLQAQFDKIDHWAKTGRQASLLAEAWALVAQ